MSAEWDDVPDWVREVSARLRREHPAPCALMTTVTGKCTCATSSDDQ